MINLNPYNSNQFKKEFNSSKIVKNLKKDLYTKIVYEDVFKKRYNETITGRYQAYQRIVYMASFYYIKYLQEINPKFIYDIGCGANIFKQFIPNIRGIGGPNIRGEDEQIYADEIGYVNDEYIALNKNRFESAFTINALHFTNFRSLQKTIQGFITMIKPGGRGYIALNIARLDDYSGPEEMMELFNIKSRSNDYNYTAQERIVIDTYIRNIIDKLTNIKPLVFELIETNDEYIDGNIRLVFEKV